MFFAVGEKETEKCGCGGEGVLKGRKKYKVVCQKCGAQGPVKPLPSQAIAAWNLSNKKVKRDE